jgi:hypothetical protein
MFFFNIMTIGHYINFLNCDRQLASLLYSIISILNFIIISVVKFDISLYFFNLLMCSVASFSHFLRVSGQSS